MRTGPTKLRLDVGWTMVFSFEFDGQAQKALVAFLDLYFKIPIALYISLCIFNGWGPDQLKHSALLIFTILIWW